MLSRTEERQSQAGLITAVTGDATYQGSAAGVRSRPSAVDFFSASATLNAEFGAVDAAGAITGKIHGIVAGGVAVGQDIYLDVTPESNPGYNRREYRR